MTQLQPRSAAYKVQPTTTSLTKFAGNTFVNTYTCCMYTRQNTYIVCCNPVKGMLICSPSPNMCCVRSLLTRKLHALGEKWQTQKYRYNTAATSVYHTNTMINPHLSQIKIYFSTDLYVQQVAELGRYLYRYSLILQTLQEKQELLW